MKDIILEVFLLCSFVSFSQKKDTIQAEAWKQIYRGSATKINDLVHTKLDLSFDYSRSWMYGKAWITLHPHFSATDSLNLDAKGMTINKVSMMKAGVPIPLKYVYDGRNLRIILDKTYSGGENYTVFIEYIAKPDEIKEKGKLANPENKGLYFINPTGKEKNKPIQIWTQGETESNSVWFPTIDKPNQKTTDEISMTVPVKYQTLSNGLLIKQKLNSNGTRTDTWKMDLPHAPYLMMLAVGEYSIIKDSYKGKEVSYYVEKEFAPVAKKIFGFTPEMIDFFSRITGVNYPWPKYAQIVCRDFISGAMENTTATLHGEDAQQNERQLIDGNQWEWVIAHELFHQWFGNYVTNESWSNVTVNESFANFSEVLWMEYKHGKDAGDALNNNEMYNYIHYGNAIHAMENLNIENDTVRNAAEPILTDLANNDPKSLVRAEAIKTLGKFKKDVYKPLFLTSINDSSYTIAGNALLALGALDSVAALDKANELPAQNVKGTLYHAINETLFMYSSESEFDSLAVRFDNLPEKSYAKYRQLDSFTNFLKRVKNSDNFRKGIDLIVSYRDSFFLLDQSYALPYINGELLKDIVTFKQSLGMTEQADYVNSKLPAKPKDQEPVEIAEETLLKYPGEYNNNLETFKVTLKDDKTLNLISENGSEMELTVLSKDKFSVKDMKGYSVEFTVNEKDEVSKMLFIFSDEQVKELKKK